jgi:hypothetical protein
MVDEQDPPKRVVKRVVKKTVVRPVAPAEPAPKLRYGRPVAPATKPRATVQSRAAGPSRSATTTAEPRPTTTTKVAPRPAKAPRQRIDVRSKVSAARSRTSGTWHTAAGTIGSGARTSGSFVAERARAVAAWRLPHINPYLAAVVTGAVVGLVAVGLGVLALAVFQEVRGVSSGGGLWGGLTFAGLALVAVALGDALLRGFGAHSSRLTSVFAVVLTIIAMLGLFLDLTDSLAAVALLPLLGAATFTLSYWLIDLAESTPPVTD